MLGSHGWCETAGAADRAGQPGAQGAPGAVGPDCTKISSLKKERVRKLIYKTRELARADIFDYIEVFYNRTCRHNHLGGLSPEAFEHASP